MIPCIQKNISAFPKKIMGVQSTPASNHPFQLHPPAEARPLPEEQACINHHTTAQLLFLCHVRQDSQTAIVFLTTREVKQPDKDDWSKLKPVLKYLRSTLSLPLALLWSLSQTSHGMLMGTGSILNFCRGDTKSLSMKQKFRPIVHTTKPKKQRCKRCKGYLSFMSVLG